MAFHVLYLSYDGLTDALGQSQILAYQQKIASKELSVTIVSFEKRSTYEKLGEDISSTCKASHIDWKPIFYTKNPPVLSTLYDLWVAWKKIKETHTSKSIHIIHCRGYISALLGEKAKKVLGFKFIFDMRGWWPDEKLESGHWTNFLFKPVYNFFKQKEKDFFIHSDFTVSLTEAGKKEIVEKGYKKETKIGVVATCTNLQLFNQMPVGEKALLKKELGFPLDSKILVYSGALGGNYPIEDIMLFVHTFLQMSPQHHCLILSKDKLAETVPLPDKTILLSVNYKEVGKHLAICDLAFLYYKRSFSNIGRCPTKLGEYWACGLPVISPAEIGDIESIFKNYPNSGLTLANWSKEEIEACIATLLAKPTDKNELRKAAEEYFSLDKGVDFYKKLYASLENESH